MNTTERSREEHGVRLVAEEGESLSSGSLRLYGLLRPETKGEEEKIAGIVELYSYDPLNQRCGVGIAVGKDCRRQGVGYGMLKELEEMYGGGKSKMLHVLYADIEVSNEASLSLFEKAGYSRCGYFREWIAKNENYTDTIRMQLILR